MAKHLKRTGICQLHGGEHRPRVSDTDIHHVWPKEYGGPDEASNEVETCPTGHRNCHELLRLYLAHKGVPPWSELQKFHPAEREACAKAWQHMIEAGRTAGRLPPTIAASVPN